MSNDSSSVTEGFDLNSQAGVMAVLLAVRSSQLSSAEKNELRDLVFLYSNGGGDNSVRIALEQKLIAHHIAPVVPQRGGVAAPGLAFGSYRPTPNFRAPEPAPLPKTYSYPPIPTTPIAETTPPQPTAPPIPAPKPIPAPVAPIPPPAPAVPVSIPEPISSYPQSAPPPIIATPTPTAPPAVSQADEAIFLERIKQIKTAVNSKVGNPVNLVDIDNAVGREYMNALLEAMKKLSSGAVSEMPSAMKRLEIAFEAVQIAIERHLANQPLQPRAIEEASVTIPNPTVPTPVPTPLSQPAVTPPVVDAPSPLPPPMQLVPPPLPPRIETPADFITSAMPTAPLPVTTIDRAIGQLANNVYVEPRIMPPAPPIPPDSPSGYDQTVSNPQLDPKVKLDNASKTPASLAASAPLKTPRDLPDSDSLLTSANGDPLFTKEVDDGLEQLLSDWSLFKRSGLFGTGPHGRQHPLYKRIADLQVPLLLAGRFEGASQEIRQSITDYMNGWRYEQGIIYQPGETFEGYLRRVIRHILDLQKKRQGA